MKRQGGFTLIELVVVIVILGILAVTAAPRFLNLQSDARASSLQGLKGAMAGATGIVYGGAAIAGIEGVAKGATATPIVNDTVVTNFGYPTATAVGSNAIGIEAAVEGLPGSDWEAVTVADNVTPDAVAYSFVGTDDTGFTYDSADATNNVGCFVIYVEAADDTTPAFADVVADDC